MSIQFHFTSIILMILSSFLFLGCQEKDDLYGNSPADYRPSGSSTDKAAADYFRQKQVTCFDIKSDFQANKSTGWIDIGFIFQNPDGSIEMTATTSNSVARLNFVYETPARDGGILIMEIANKTGFDKISFLHACNQEKNYFYIADFASTGNELLNVLAFSISDKDLPAINEAAHMHGPFKPGSKLVGVTAKRGIRGPALLTDKIGNVPATAVFMRQSFCNVGDQLWSANPSIQISKVCQGGNLQGVTLDRFTVYHPTPGTWYAAGPAIELFTRGNPQVAARITEYPLPDRFNKKANIRVYRARRLVHNFIGYVSGTFSTTATEVSINI